jgi:hypothetical protein
MPEEEKKEKIEEESIEEVEEISEDEEENQDENSDEELIEEQEYRTSRLNQILANPWKQVSLEERGIASSPSLEANFESQNFQEDSDNSQTLNYLKGPDEEDERQYQKAGTQGQFENTSMSQEERTLEEQKRLYSSPQGLRPENRRSEQEDMGIVTPESTMKKNYLTGRKF